MPAPSLPTPLPPLCLSAPAPGVPEMGDFAAPSFSLGLDLDDLSTEEEPEGDEKSPMEGPEGGRSPLPGASISRSRHFQQVRGGDEERDFPMEDPGEDASLSTPALRRLKRGPPPMWRREMRPWPPDDSSTPGDARQFSTLDDDIEEFSSQEDPVVRGGWLLRPVSLLHWSGSGKPWIRLDANRPCPLDALWAPYDLHGPSS